MRRSSLGLVGVLAVLGGSAAAAPPDSAERTQCKAIVQKAWGAVKPVVARLGVSATPELEARYVGDEAFIGACASLPQEQRDCLAKSENPVAGIDACGVNQPTRKLWTYDFGRDIDLWPATPLTPEEVAAKTRWLRGTWVSDWAKIKQTTRWVVGKDGQVTSAEVTKDGKARPANAVPDLLSFKDSGHLYLRWQGSTTTQTLSFFEESDDVFYASTNELYAAYPVPDEKHFTVRHGWEYIVYDKGRCEVITGIGLVVPATCEFDKAGAQRLFKTTFTRPGATRPMTVAHVVIGKHFLVDAMVETARFVRQK